MTAAAQAQQFITKGDKVLGDVRWVCHFSKFVPTFPFGPFSYVLFVYQGHV